VNENLHQRSRVPPEFESLAYLYQPADPSIESAIVEADERWLVPQAVDDDVDVVLWGRLARNERPSAGLLPIAIRREIAIAQMRTRPSGRFRVVALHRLPPVRRPGIIRGPIRAATLGGVLVEMVRRGGVGGDRPTRVIDAVVSAAGSDPSGLRLRPSGDGSALARITLADGTEAELRVAKAGHTKDPARGYAGLQALESARVPMVPRPLGGGTTAGAAWSAESVMTGTHVQALTADLVEQVTAFLAVLPVGTGPRQAIDDHLEEVALFFPEHAAELKAVAEAAARWSAGLRPVLIHGDLWLNNLFTVDGQLTAVFDWDTWHPSGLPGTDLLTLLAAEARTRERRDIGPLLIEDYWRSEEVVDALTTYFRSRTWAFPDPAGLAAIATGWWASRMASSLHRALRQIDDPAWVQRNLVDALPRFEQLVRELG
jgi:phosphotransferase family enzyme